MDVSEEHEELVAAVYATVFRCNILSFAFYSTGETKSELSIQHSE